MVPVILLVIFALVLVVFGFGFVAHLLWFAAMVMLVLWLIGLVLGRGEGGGRHRFYRW